MKRIFLLASFGFLLLIYPASAEGEPCILETTLSNAQVTGLTSAPDFSGVKVNVNGQKVCVKNERAAFVSYKLPTYEDLKSLYFTQSKASKTNIGEQTNQGNLQNAVNSGYQVVTTTNLGLNGDVSAGPPFVVFVDGSLLFDTNFTYGGPGSGMVFVVKGDVNIEKAVTRVDAVIISEGTICTSYDKVGNSCSDSNVPLLINGSLISLNQAKPILFRRRLADNSLPAEKIVWQPKYLVILKDLFADTYQKWSEIQ